MPSTFESPEKKAVSLVAGARTLPEKNLCQSIKDMEEFPNSWWTIWQLQQIPSCNLMLWLEVLDLKN